MKNLIIMTSLLFSFNLLAGPGGGHSHGQGHSHGKKHVKIEKTKEMAKTHVDRLVKAGKIDKSWGQSTYDKSVQKRFGKKFEWVVTFDNEKGIKGKKLYIFLSLSGNFIAANFSGK